MTGYRGKAATNSTREVVGVQAQAEREAMWGEITGTIVSFNSSTQTASIQPDYKPRHNGEPVDMPELAEVPVRFQRAGGFIITQPVKAGDKVTLRPLMRSSEEFHTGGDFTPVGDTRSMALSDMEAHLAGGEALTDPITGFNSDNMEIRTADGSFKIEMSEDGKFKIVGAQGDWFDMLARLAEIVADHMTIDESGSWPHDLAGEAAEIAAKLRGSQV